MTRSDGERHAPSGWYPDPHTPDSVRWWDGQRWTQVVKPTNATIDPRGRRLLVAGYVLLTAGMVATYIAFPWIASEPVAGHKDPNPLWVTVLSILGVIAMALGVVCLIAHWIVRRRKKKDRPRAA